METSLIIARRYTKEDVDKALATLMREISGFAKYSKSGRWDSWVGDCVFMASRLGVPWEGNRIVSNEVPKVISNWLNEVASLCLGGDGDSIPVSSQSGEKEQDKPYCQVVVVRDNTFVDGLEIRIRESKHESDDFVLTFAPVDEYSRIMKPETEMLKIKEALGRNANNESAADQAGEFVYDEMPHKEGM